MSINSRTIIHIKLNNIHIERVTFYKFLDIIIDYILNWKQNILFLKSKIKKTYGLPTLFPNLLIKKHYFIYIIPYSCLI